MTNEKYMAGLKFYRYPESNGFQSPIPEVLRLIKQESENLTFNFGGYKTYITIDDFNTAIDHNLLIHLKDNEYEYIYKFSKEAYAQKWILHGDLKKDIFIEFFVTNMKKTISLSELKDAEYTKLTPDGFVTLGCPHYIDEATNQKNKSVMLTVHKYGSNIPTIVCRPDAVDIFRAPSMAQTFNMPMGVCVSTTTLPKGMNILQFMCAEKITGFKSAAIYIDDGLNTIMKYLSPINKYNAAIRRIYDSYSQTPGLIFNSTNLHQLFVDTGLYDEIRTMFGLFPYPFAMDTRSSKMTDILGKNFSRIITGDMGKYTNIEYCPYDKTIDLSQINRPHMLINTGDQFDPNIFLVTYDEAY